MEGQRMALILTDLTLLSKIGGEVILSDERVYLDRQQGRTNGGGVMERENGTEEGIREWS